MTGCARPLQGADILLVQANRGRNQSCHTLTIQRTARVRNGHTGEVEWFLGVRGRGGAMKTGKVLTEGKGKPAWAALITSLRKFTADFMEGRGRRQPPVQERKIRVGTRPTLLVARVPMGTLRRDEADVEMGLGLAGTS